MKRVFLADLLGGIAMFAWSSLAHVVLPLGMTGIQEIPNEAPVLAALQSSLAQNHGLYIFPATGAPAHATAAQRRAAMQDYQKKLDANPSGLLIYHPAGAQALTGRQLGTEFLTEFLEALLAACLLAQARIAGYGGRLGFVLLAGIMAGITTNLPYWNWYGFPTSCTAAYMTIEIVGYLCAGLVAAALVKPKV